MPVVDDLLAALAQADQEDEKKSVDRLHALATQVAHPEVGPQILANTMLSPRAQHYLDKVMEKKGQPAPDPLGGGIYMQNPRAGSPAGLPAMPTPPPAPPKLDRTGYPPYALAIPASEPTALGTAQRRVEIILHRLRDRLNNNYESRDTDANKHDQGGE